MIDPRELRIGNILQSIDKDGDGSVIIVKEFSLGGVNPFVSQAGYEYEYVYEKTDYYDWYWVVPIELSPEWMVKLGFEKNLGGHYMDIKDLGFMNYDNGILEIGIMAKYPIAAVESKIRYVHQLQNLYFALTGEEITIQPKQLT